ncbi:FtsW/RodA/SpoVE family cell cycle protein [Brevibacillus laterosporus]|uniref:FtsW/RodA/SpoVE family cell cycle protein n=1 Tax=Brevibacillus laterosporus TaxID=1465 RepID=UPI003458E28D
MYSFGWVLGIIFVTLIAFFVIRITRMIKRVNDSYGKRVITSFLMIFSLTFMGNILMSAGLLPILLDDPIPLPFINDIGIHLMYKFIDLGIIISVYRHKDLISAQAQVK